VSGPVDNRPAGAPRLWGGLNIRIKPGSLAHSIYGKTDIEETFGCNYELNHEYSGILENKGMVVSGKTDDGGIRIMELPGNVFYLVTGFLPQLNSKDTGAHPLIIAFLEASLKS
jgi:CTP synthase